jgi:repressor LexA
MDLTRLARILMIPKERLEQLQKGDPPNDFERGVFRTYFGVPEPYPSSVLTDDSNVVPMVWGQDNRRRIPVLGRVPAGVPVEAVEDVIEMLELDAPMANDGNAYFALLVTGDSMVPEYRDGDVVIVRVQSTAETGDDVVAYVGDSDATLKRFIRTRNGVELRPLNPDYPTLRFTNEEVAALPVSLAGVVVELRRRRR